MLNNQILELDEKVESMSTEIEELEEKIRTMKKERTLIRNAKKRLEGLQERLSDSEEEDEVEEPWRYNETQ